MNRDYIVLKNLKDPNRLCQYFDSCLVDVAYADIIGTTCVKVFVEDDTDLRKEDVLKWLLDIIQDSLWKNKEFDGTIKIVLSKESE